MAYNLVDQKFGRLTVLERAGRNSHGERTWRCKCDCGNECVVPSYALVKGRTRSCGCYMIDRIKETNHKFNEFYQDKNGNGVCILSDGSEFLFDWEDLQKVSKYSWHADANDYICTGTIKNGKAVVRFHRLVMDAPDGYVVDHINHNKRDNRKKNLRVCTFSENGMNKIPMSKSGLPRGITIARNKYVAQITINYQHKSLGAYAELKDAVAARKKAEEKYFGRFNYKEEDEKCNDIQRNNSNS